MRLMLLAVAGAAILAGPASAQGRHAEEAQRVIDEAVPAMDRATQALLNLDIGPILDAVDPYGPHPHRTLRDMARRDDPDFERNLRASIHGSAASLQRMTAVAAAAEPALRQVMAQFQASIAAATDAPNAAPPPYRGAEPPMAEPMPYRDEREDYYPEDEGPPPPPEPYDE
jgi:hypothetical protein